MASIGFVRETTWQLHSVRQIGMLLQTALACVAMAILGGCGKSESRYPAHGQVAYADGSPLASGMVVFRQVDRPSSSARGLLNSDGTFELHGTPSDRGVPPGEYEAIVVPDIPDALGGMSPAEYDRARRPIDPKYRNYETSGLRFTVAPSETDNQFRIRVDRPPR